MNPIRSKWAALAALAVVLLGASPAGAQEVLEQVVVKNPLYSVRGKLELSLDAGMTVVNRLTYHYNFNLGVAYNITDRWALEVRGGYALSGHTGLAGQVGGNLLARSPSGPDAEVVTVNDLSNLWEMKANLVAGVRWAPLYGKI